MNKVSLLLMVVMLSGSSPVGSENRQQPEAVYAPEKGFSYKVAVFRQNLHTQKLKATQIVNIDRINDSLNMLTKNIKP